MGTTLKKIMGYKMKGPTFFGKSPLKAKTKTSSAKSDAPQDKKKADRIFGQELQLNKDGKTYNARGQDYQVAGVTDIIADPKGILKKNTDEDGYVKDMDFSFETRGDTTFITGIKEDAAHTPKPPKSNK